MESQSETTQTVSALKLPLSVLLEITLDLAIRDIETPLSSPMEIMWCLCDLTPSDSLDLGVSNREEVENGTNNEEIRSMKEKITREEIEELVEMPRSQPIGYYLKHEINKELIEGIAEDVLVEIAGYIYPVDFMILDVKEDKKKPFILGTPFLTTAKAEIRKERRDEKKRLDHLKQDQSMLVIKRFSERKKIFRERKKTRKIRAKRLKKTTVVTEVTTADAINKEVEDPEGYKVVNEFMLHEPWGKDAKYAPCNIEEKCSKRFPKAFYAEIIIDADGYPIYRKRDNKASTVKGKFKRDLAAMGLTYAEIPKQYVFTLTRIMKVNEYYENGEIDTRKQDFNKWVLATVEETYPDFTTRQSDDEYLKERAILTPRNNDADAINAYMFKKLEGESVTYNSADEIFKALTDTLNQQDLYPFELLNSLNFSGMPPHALCLKIELPIMLLRNVNPSQGLCN
ncbi:ATP-dependent DNA helicase PIF1-like protein [Tanacetum coccineum]